MCRIANKKLTFKIDADISGFEREMRKLSKGLDNAAKNMRKFGLEISRISAPLIGLGALAFRSALKIEDAMKSIKVGTGAVGKSLATLENDFKNVARSVALPLAESADIVADLNTYLGISGRPLQAMSKAIAEASRMTGESSKEMTSAVATAMNNARLSSYDGEEFLDKLFVAAQNTGIGMTSLAEGVKRYGASLRGLGYSSDEMVELIASMNKAGVDAGAVMSALQKGLAHLAREGSNNIPGAMAEIISSIRNAGSSAEAAQIAFDRLGRNGPVIAQLVREGVLSFDGLGKSLEGSRGAISATAKETDNFISQVNRVKNELSLAGDHAGKILIDLAERYILPFAHSFAEASPAVSRLVVELGVLAVAAGPASWAFGELAHSAGTVARGLKGTAGLFRKLAVKGAAAKLASDFSSFGIALSKTSTAALATGSSMVRASGLMGKFAFAGRGLISVLTGPAGILTALGATAAYLAYDFCKGLKAGARQAEALKAKIKGLKESLSGLSVIEIKLKKRLKIEGRLLLFSIAFLLVF